MNSQLLQDDIRTNRVPKWHVFARSAAAFSLAGTLTLGSLLGMNGAALAQETSTGTSAAAIVPETAAVYFGFSLDTTSPQWVLADELLKRAGAEDSVSTLVDDAASSLVGSSIGWFSRKLSTPVPPLLNGFISALSPT